MLSGFVCWESESENLNFLSQENYFHLSLRCLKRTPDRVQPEPARFVAIPNSGCSKFASLQPKSDVTGSLCDPAKCMLRIVDSGRTIVAFWLIATSGDTHR